jgi:predicted Zn-dependent protease
MNMRIWRWLIFAVSMVSTLLGASSAQADQPVAIGDLQAATDVILSYARGAPASADRVLESAELLRAYELTPWVMVTALSRLQREAPSSASRRLFLRHPLKSLRLVPPILL